MTKFSIITPQYNSFELMENYFASMEKQTFKDFEIVIVDDCSTDNSYQKLQEYIEKSPLDIHLYKSEKNSGPGNARNIGLDHAKGQWVSFVDNDDWVVEDFLEKISNVIENKGANCVIYDYYTWLDGKTNIARSMYDSKGGHKTISECLISVRNHTIGKVYKRELCKNVRYPNLRRYEDVAYVTQAIAACGSAYYYNEPLYYYRQRPTSLSNNSKMDHTDMVKAFSILEEKFLEDYPLEIKNKSVTDILYGGLLMMCKAGRNNSFIRDYIDKYEDRYPNWWECEIINYIGSAKQLFLKCAHYRFIIGLKTIAFAHSLMIKKGS